jgi:hypothetical protein
VKPAGPADKVDPAPAVPGEPARNDISHHAETLADGTHAARAGHIGLECHLRHLLKGRPWRQTLTQRDAIR